MPLIEVIGPLSWRASIWKSRSSRKWKSPSDALLA